EPPPADNLSMAEAFANYLGGNAATIPNINAQATFLAQLIGQDITIPPETAGILVQYEKLDAYSQVKYKPSNAQKPQAAPSNVFSRILQEEHAAPVVPAAAPPANAPVAFQWVKAQGAPAPRPVVSKAAKGAEAYAESAGRIAVSANTLAESA
ncbi:MAG: hypothetical protein KGJ21_09545, partial [Pseudomonadota bacterium]|nr:hypothetical protein [Pseudomonadota bacterium]